MGVLRDISSVHGIEEDITHNAGQGVSTLCSELYLIPITCYQ